MEDLNTEIIPEARRRKEWVRTRGRLARSFYEEAKGQHTPAEIIEIMSGVLMLVTKELREACLAIDDSQK